LRPVLAEQPFNHINFTNFSWREASTKFGLEAFFAGCRLRIMQTTTANKKAPIAHSAEKTGLIIRDQVFRLVRNYSAGAENTYAIPY
jgi:hypothetical protein